MILVLVTAFIAACGADKLDRTYLPPASAATAGGTGLQTPFKTFNQGLGSFPKGSYSNDFEGVVVDASAPGTRASGADDTGLGGPRIAYGSLNSKVGEAAFTAESAFPRVGVNAGLNQGTFPNQQTYGTRPERVQSTRDRVSNTVKYESDVSPDRFNYAFETDNGIVAEENGVEVNGVRAQGGYSYTGDDGQVYSVTYTADEEGYRPKGDHLPTPPPIPAEILVSLEKNAQDEAAGIIDDGSYDAQKYNTGEDYTKSDNGQYNNGQPIQIGSRPQSDAIVGDSFNYQNNQGYVRPNSQYGSTTSFYGTNNVPSNGNNFASGNAVNPGQNTQTFGFGGSSNEYLPPSNNLNSNQRPPFNRPQGIQSDVGGSPISSYNSNDNSGFNTNQNTGTPAFIPLSQQKLQNEGPKRPQSSSTIFGKPTIIDSTLAIRDPFAKRPSGNRFTQNKQPTQKPFGGSFEVVSGNVYSSKNEYLPPRRQSNKPSQVNGNQRFPGTTSGVQPNQQFINSQNYNSNSPSASAFASATRPSFQSSQQYNKPQFPLNPSSNNGFEQSNQNSNIRPSNQAQSSFGSNVPPIVPNFDGSPAFPFKNRPSTFLSQFPTLKPQTELSTPAESNFDGKKDNAPNPIIDGPDSPNDSSSTGLSSYGTQPSGSYQGQYSINSNNNQQPRPTQPTAPSTLSDQTFTPDSQQFGNLGSQSQSSNLPENGQYSFSTQRPSFNQYTQQQGSDDSYYYNTPSKPFNTPTPRPQGSIFPSTAFDQSSKVTQTPFGSKPISSPTPGTFFTQSNTPAEDTKYPQPSTLESISPNVPTQQDEQNGNTFNTQFNKVTQASSSSFPSPTPTTAPGSNGNQFGQYNPRPSQSSGSINPETQSFNPQSPQSTKPQQQYGGEIYEYNKPTQTFPSQQNAATSGPAGQTSQFGNTPSNPPVSHTQPGAYRPSTQFGSAFTQQPFGQKPQDSQNGQQFQPNNQQFQPRPGQFNQPNSQPIQGASKFPPTYKQPAPTCCKQIPKGPSQTSQADEPGETPQFNNQFRPNQEQQGSDQGVKPIQSVSTFPGLGESFGGPRKPPSFDSNGYHY